MENFLEFIKGELSLQRALLKESKKSLKKCPEGCLTGRNRKNQTAYYQKKQVNGVYRELNISDQEELIRALVDKKLYKMTLAGAEKNIKALETLKSQYHPNSYLDLIPNMPQSYCDAVKALGQSAVCSKAMKKPIQYHYDEEKHIHETICGLKVRSKSEVIITNALTSYGIPFSYEKDFSDTEYDTWPLQPDFTFELPDGEMKLWEHLGLLNKMDYCTHNAYKLYAYQRQGYQIGRNLIITQDDAKGNCSSPFIDQVIRQHLLPYYR